MQWVDEKNPMEISGLQSDRIILISFIKLCVTIGNEWEFIERKLCAVNSEQSKNQSQLLWKGSLSRRLDDKNQIKNE